MWSSTIAFDKLQERNRWKVEFFCSPEGESEHTDGVVAIRSLVRERKESVEPSTLGSATVNYVGLENVLSLTGELVSFEPRCATEVKSRSKVFKAGDILFGRLRPNLNKVWLADGTLGSGICSTEFFVLVPESDLVRPLILRYLLSSHHVQRHAIRLQTGTALPRMNLDDLLDIEVPVPPLSAQMEIEAELQRKFEELVSLRARLERLPESILSEFLTAVESGQGAANESRSSAW